MMDMSQCPMISYPNVDLMGDLSNHGHGPVQAAKIPTFGSSFDSGFKANT